MAGKVFEIAFAIMVLWHKALKHLCNRPKER